MTMSALGDLVLELARPSARPRRGARRRADRARTGRPPPPSCRRRPAGAITSVVPSPAVRARWASTVGVLPRPMSSARHPPSSAASRKPIHASASAWYAAQLTVEAVGRGDRRSVDVAARCRTMSLAQLSPCTTTPPAQPGPVETDALAQDLGAGQLRDRLPLGQRGGGLLEVDAIDLHPAAARLHQRAGLTGEARRSRPPSARRRRTRPTRRRC